MGKFSAFIFPSSFFFYHFPFVNDNNGKQCHCALTHNTQKDVLFVLKEIWFFSCFYFTRMNIYIFSLALIKILSYFGKNKKSVKRDMEWHLNLVILHFVLFWLYKIKMYLKIKKYWLLIYMTRVKAFNTCKLNFF